MSFRDLPLDNWPRRAAFEHFRHLAQPAFGVTAQVDVTGLRERAAHHGATPWLAYHHAALEAANSIDAFRQCLAPNAQGVREYAEVHASTTVLRDDGSFGFLTLPREAHLGHFAARAKQDLARVRASSGQLFLDELGAVQEETLIHMTTLPWIAFTSFTQARGAADDRPKVAFGKFMAGQGGGLLMPVAVEVHHALCDGLHVGQFFERLQARLDAV